jgi:hypothetical protein
MPNRTELEAALWSILDALRPYAEDMLLIGGWAPYLHLTYGRAAEEGARTSLTAEADLVVPGRLPRGERPPVAEILEGAGYHRLLAAAAVWEKAPEHGERIEFFQTHRGPASRLSTIRPVGDQPGLEALSLDHLWILGAFTDFVLVPAPEDGGQPAPARIPLLGAFALNKANTFSLRGGGDGSVRSAKDLLYLRDIMAAGQGAVATLEADFDTMLASAESRSVRDYIRRGVVHLKNVATRFHALAGDVLSERDGVESAAARADVEGYLTDLTELLGPRDG